MQLHRALSKLGLCSRKQAVELILSGKVLVNGKVNSQPLVWVDLASDEICLHSGSLDAGRPLMREKKIYLAVNKPRGYITTRSDERGRKTVYDFLPSKLKKQWIFPVGRLDKESEGLLLMTNDGPWADRITSPKNKVLKTYEVTLNRDPSQPELDHLRGGVPVRGVVCVPAEIKKERSLVYSLKIQEGKNRQVRLMFAAIRCRVKTLVRTKIGNLSLERLGSKTFQLLSSRQLSSFFSDEKLEK